jgi:hypothetical protein
MFITLVVTICLNTNNLVCDELVITDSTTSIAPLSMSACLGYEGQISAGHYLQEHNLAQEWFVKGWKCQFGNRPRPDNKRI